MSNLTPKEQAELTVKALKKRRELKEKAGKEADKVTYGRVFNAKNKRNKKYY